MQRHFYIPLHIHYVSLLSGEPQRIPSEDNADDTLTLDALSATQAGQESSMSVSAIDLAALGISGIGIDKTMKGDSSEFNA